MAKTLEKCYTPQDKGLDMPCYDHRDSGSYVWEEKVKPLQEKCDLYASWLCYLLEDVRFELPDDLAQWWEEHKHFDATR